MSFDVQWLNEAGKPVRQFKVPEDKTLEFLVDMIKLMNDQKVYCVNIRKTLEEKPN